MSEKKVPDYQKLVKHLDIPSSELLMIGNSLKSDVLPLVEIGASAIHIPFHTTWAHETVTEQQKSTTAYKTLSNIKEVLAYL